MLLLHGAILTLIVLTSMMGFEGHTPPGWQPTALSVLADGSSSVARGAFRLALGLATYCLDFRYGCQHVR